MNHINVNFEIEKAKKLTKTGYVEEAKKVYENIILHYQIRNCILAINAIHQIKLSIYF